MKKGSDFEHAMDCASFIRGKIIYDLLIDSYIKGNVGDNLVFLGYFNSNRRYISLEVKPVNILGCFDVEELLPDELTRVKEFGSMV